MSRMTIRIKRTVRVKVQYRVRQRVVFRAGFSAPNFHHYADASEIRLRLVNSTPGRTLALPSASWQRLSEEEQSELEQLADDRDVTLQVV